MSDTEQRIRDRAYQLWEQAGRPHDRGEEFWFAARREIEGAAPPAITPDQSARPVQAARAVGTQEARKSAATDEAPQTDPKRGTKRPRKR